jgi:hypothetical protein
VADFDPFANQGGPAAWDPEHGNDSKKLTDELLKKLAEADDDPGAGPSTFAREDGDEDDDATSAAPPDRFDPADDQD